MGTNHICASLVAGLALSCLGCGDPDFNDSKTRAIVGSQQWMLNGEQITLNQQLVDCGVDNDLWFPPTQVSQNRYIARLTEQGKALKFSDDVSIGEPGFPQPYVQVNGAFDLQMDDIYDTHDLEQGVKRVVAKLSVKIPHACFPNPIPIMGVKKGHFDESAPATIDFALTDIWRLDKVVHQ
jgi:hypothetical protein